MKTKSKISGYIIRSAAYAVFLSVAFIAAGSAFNSPNRWGSPTGAYEITANTLGQVRAFTFAERVAYQRAIEDVYWRHRIWPKENPDPKPSLNAVMSQTQLENKVADYLRDSQALEDYWQRPITAERLQAEMDRIARDTKQPEVLRELFEALGNDPAVIAQCLARPVLTERLIGDLPAQDKSRRPESPRTNDLRTLSMATTSGQVAYTLPTIAGVDDPPCTGNTWTVTSIINAPDARHFLTAIWTGSEMIVWGGDVGVGVGTNTGGRYNPSTDSWTVTSTTNAPSARESYNTAVWTGTEMIVWGGTPDGINGLNTGGRYNPSTDTWTATSTTNAPSARFYQTTVWTGSEMIVWGGSPDGINVTNTGGRYDPSTDTWTTTSTTNAPSARAVHTAVWTGSEMIIWGGIDATFNGVNTGSRYDPSTDTWTATSTTNAPSARVVQSTAVWTGTEMIVWGGADQNLVPFNTGGRYNPVTDGWTATSIINAPSARFQHTAVWTGSEMIVWGGTPDGINNLNTGGRYCAPAPRPTPTPRPRPTPFPRPTL
jgi:N-acetylneuraminic acid mutarotase